MKLAKEMFLMTFFCIALCIPQLVHAQQVSKVKGKRVLIEAGDLPIEVGQSFFLVDEAGKKRAIVEITNVKGNRAIGQITKGKGAKTGWTLQERKAKKGTTDADVAASEAEANIKNQESEGSKIGLGLLLGYGMDSMEVKVNGQNVAHKGTGISYKLMADVPIISSLAFRATLGIENFNAESSENIAPNTKGEVEIAYMTLDFWARWMFSQEGMFRPWAGATLGLLFPNSKKSSSIEESTIANTSILGVGGGADLHFSPSFYMPVQVEYGILPSSDEVSGSLIALRVGFAMSF